MQGGKPGKTMLSTALDFTSPQYLQLLFNSDLTGVAW